ncbi:hypothetical protein B620_gp26 [Croceibacter phage P2559S]|uniref:hypothetical protein n=1 Tax=Croceibacter phage P2559S TaxID=1176422 RepID=UPI0002688EB5|nr:hypothetical protein B620_gp26 [Croceibacter phage P2559S]AFM54804.1 hypothetical protein P2559S_26 [Croceibacter phage P2559S]
MFNFISAVIALQANYEGWGLKSVLIGGIIGLATAVGFLYKSKEAALQRKDDAMAAALKEKDDKIMAVIENHQKDLKEANNDMKVFVEKYHQFTQHLKEVVNARSIPK